MNDDLRARWHQATCRVLEAQVRSRSFFLVVRVEPEQDAPEQDARQGEPEHAGAEQVERGPATGPEEVGDPTWESVAESVERWLEGLDPDAVGEGRMPSFEVRPGGTLIELTAVPKKRSRRGSDPLISNPFPGIADFPGFYSSGPAADPGG